MIKDKEEFMKSIGSVKCTCGYWNKDFNIKRYGTCTRCHKVLDKKAYFEYCMIVKLKAWRDKRCNY